MQISGAHNRKEGLRYSKRTPAPLTRTNVSNCIPVDASKMEQRAQLPVIQCVGGLKFHRSGHMG